MSTDPPAAESPVMRRYTPLETEFDWAGFESRYGSAAAVPEKIQESLQTSDPEKALSILHSVYLHANVDDWLYPSAPAMAALLLEASTEARVMWPYLFLVFGLLRGHYSHCISTGFAPKAFTHKMLGGLSFEEDLEQEAVFDRCVEEIRSRAMLLEAIVAARTGADRALAVSLQALTARGSKEQARIRQNASRLLLAETDDLARCNLLTAHWFVSGDRLPLPEHMLTRRAPSPGSSVSDGLAAALRMLWRRSSPIEAGRVADREREAILGALEVQDSLLYFWHAGLVAGDVLHAVIRSRLCYDDQEMFLRHALSVSPVNEYAYGVAETALWYFLRRHFGRHFGRTTAAGPEDLSASERERLASLVTLSDNWINSGSLLVETYGICMGLAHGIDGLLEEVVPGIYRGDVREASRWTWLYSPLFESPASPVRDKLLERHTNIVTRGLDLKSHARLCLLVLEHKELRPIPVFLSLLERWREGTAEELALPISEARFDLSRPAPEPDGPGRPWRGGRDLLALILRAGWGDPSDPVFDLMVSDSDAIRLVITRLQTVVAERRRW